MILFNYQEQLARVQTQLKTESDEAGKILDTFMEVIFNIKDKLHCEFDLKMYIDKCESQVKDLVFSRENRLKVIIICDILFIVDGA